MSTYTDAQLGTLQQKRDMNSHSFQNSFIMSYDMEYPFASLS